MGKNNHLIRSVVPPSSAQSQKKTTYVDKEAAELENPFDDGNDKKVFVSIRLIQSDHQCFYEWDKTQMKSFWRFNKKLHEVDWATVYASARKENKTGFAYTPIPTNKYPDSEFKKTLSPEITLFELRGDNEIRVHGFRSKSIFYACWLDRNHDICK